ncbi:hypothetical protein SEVIR_6G014800v4 [Setaria viridis]
MGSVITYLEGEDDPADADIVKAKKELCAHFIPSEFPKFLDLSLPPVTVPIEASPAASTEGTVAVDVPGMKSSEEETAQSSGPDQEATRDLSRAEASFIQELVLVPGGKSSLTPEVPGVSKKIETFESPPEELPAISDFMDLNQLLVAYTQGLHEKSCRNLQVMQERSEAARRVALLEKEILEERRRTTEFLAKYDSAVASFQVEQREAEFEKNRVVARNKSLNQKLEELKGQEVILRNQVTDWRNAHSRLAEENDQLKARLEKVEKDLERESKMRRDDEVSLVGAMTSIKDQQERLQELTEAQVLSSL